MFAAFLRKLLGLIGSPTGDSGAKALQANSEPTRAIAKQADGDSKDESTAMVAYDANLLERSRTQWQFGDWASLAKLDRDTLQHHPDRANLALLAAAGHLQSGSPAEAERLIQLAQDWGVSKNLLNRILVAGVNNSLGRAAAIVGDELGALRNFNSSIRTAAPGSEVHLLVQARANHQYHEMGLPAPTPNERNEHN
jgi:hypothetical protein